MPNALYTGSAVTISTTEISLVSGTSSLQTITTPANIYIAVDLNPMAAGDEVEWRVKDKAVSGGTQRLVDSGRFNGVQGVPNKLLGPYPLGNGYDVTMIKISGTDRAYSWTLWDDAGGAPSAGVVADAVWDEVQSGHLAAGTYGRWAAMLFDGTASAGAAGTITLAGGVATDDFYKGAIVKIVSGTGAFQARVIKSYVGATKVATVYPNWATTPDNTSVFVVEPLGAFGIAGAVADEALSGHSTAGSLGKALSDLLVGVIVASINNNAITAASINAAALTAAKFATDAIDANALKADAVTKIQSGLATAASLATVAGYVDTEVADIVTRATDIQARLPAALIDGKMSSAPALVSGTASAGGSNTITLAGASTTAELYTGLIVAITSGTGAGQARRIVAYSVGRVATVHRDWATNPDNTSKYIVCPDAGHLDTSALVVADAGNTSATFKTDLTESANDHWNGSFLVFLAGSLKGQVHIITDYDGTSKFVTFTSPQIFTAAPSAGDRFLIINK